MSVNRRFILCIVFIRAVHPVDSLHNSDFAYKMHTDELMNLQYIYAFLTFSTHDLCLVPSVNEHDNVYSQSLINKLLTGLLM